MAAVLLGVLGVVLAAVAFGASGPPTPTLSASPSASPSSSPSRQFTFSSAGAVSFRCSLDGLSFTTCSSGIVVSAPANGSHSFQVKALDNKGNSSSAATHSWVVDTLPPTVTNVSSPTANGAYKAGVVIPVTVTFSEPVLVTGTPRLTLSTGSPATTAVNYSSGSGTATLTFNYTVVTGNTSPDLAYTSSAALGLNGGTIRDEATNNATLTLASPSNANSLSSNKNLVIDTTTPATPFLTYMPDDPNGDGIADFEWTMAPDETSVTYDCQVENLAFNACNTSHTVGAVKYHEFHDIVAVNNNQQHQFVVRATDAAGNTSQTAYMWKVDQAVRITIDGNTPSGQLLYPGGATLPINVVFHNPNNFPVYVNTLDVTVTGAPGFCAPGNFTIVPAVINATDKRVLVPSKGTADFQTSPVDRRPKIQMVDLPRPQNNPSSASYNCANKQVGLDFYSSSVTK